VTRRAVLGLTLVGALVATLLHLPGTAASPGDLERAASPDRPAVGLRLPRGDRAASGWVGARRLGGTVVYRTDPSRRPARAAYRRGETRAVFVAAGGRRVGEHRTACAAYLLGRFGVPPRTSPTRERRLQAAAVEVAVQHLLAGRRWRHDGVGQRRRLDAHPSGPLVRAYAEQLLGEHCRRAGPYRVSLRTAATSVRVGETVPLTVTVRSRTGAPVPDVVVTLDAAGRRLDHPTDADGRVTVEVPAVASGPLPTTAAPTRLPAHRVRVLRPRQRTATRLVVAGLRVPAAAYVRAVEVDVRAVPRLSVLQVTPKRVGQEVRPQVTLAASHPGPRTATVSLHGPLAADVTTCRPGDLRRRRSVPVARDGRYRSPATTLGRPGRYLVRVVVPRDRYNDPVVLCGSAFRVR
jgi:hypothetical protein